MGRWRRWVKEISEELWLRVVLYGVIGVATAVFSAYVEPFIPWRFSGTIDADAVSSLLNVIASSMLAVTTFSLSVMTSAYGSAANGATPRATKLLMNDRVTHTVLSTFIGSFLFSMVGLVMLKTGVYGERGRVILFVATILVIVLVVVSLLRWVDHLLKLGRLGETTDRVEAAARDAMEARLKAPYLGGERLKDEDLEPREGAWEIRAGKGAICATSTWRISRGSRRRSTATSACRSCPAPSSSRTRCWPGWSRPRMRTKSSAPSFAKPSRSARIAITRRTRASASW